MIGSRAATPTTIQKRYLIATRRYSFSWSMIASRLSSSVPVGLGSEGPIVGWSAIGAAPVYRGVAGEASWIVSRVGSGLWGHGFGGGPPPAGRRPGPPRPAARGRGGRSGRRRAAGGGGPGAVPEAGRRAGRGRGGGRRLALGDLLLALGLQGLRELFWRASRRWSPRALGCLSCLSESSISFWIACRAAASGGAVPGAGGCQANWMRKSVRVRVDAFTFLVGSDEPGALPKPPPP